MMTTISKDTIQSTPVLPKSKKAYTSMSWEEKFNFLKHLYTSGQGEIAISYIQTLPSMRSIPSLNKYEMRVTIITLKSLVITGASVIPLKSIKLILKTLIERDKESNELSLYEYELICGILHDSWDYHKCAALAKKIYLHLLKNTNLVENSPILRFKIYYFYAKSFFKIKQETAIVTNLASELLSSKNEYARIDFFKCLSYSTIIMHGTYDFDTMISSLKKEIIHTNSSLMMCFYFSQLALIFQKHFKLKEANECIKEAEKCLSEQSLIRCQLMVKLIKNSLCVGSLTYLEELLINCYPINFIFTYQTSDYCNTNIESLKHTQLNQFEKLTTHPDVYDKEDCWLINKSYIQKVHYNKSFPNFSCLDLTSGLWISKEGSSEILSPLRIKCLTLIITSSYLGCNVWQIADHIYSQDNYDSKFMLMRVQDIITQLQQKGFPLERANNRIRFNFSVFEHSIIIPCDLRWKGLIFFIAKNYTYISARDLMLNFKIRKTLACDYIKKWKNSKYIKEHPTQKGLYAIQTKWIETSLLN